MLGEEELIEAGHRVLIARDGAQALKLATEFDGHIDLLVTDVVMPVMSGPELAAHLTRLRAGLVGAVHLGLLGSRPDAARIGIRYGVSSQALPGAHAAGEGIGVAKHSKRRARKAYKDEDALEERGELESAAVARAPVLAFFRHALHHLVIFLALERIEQSPDLFVLRAIDFLAFRDGALVDFIQKGARFIHDAAQLGHLFRAQRQLLLHVVQIHLAEVFRTRRTLTPVPVIARRCRVVIAISENSQRRAADKH